MADGISIRMNGGDRKATYGWWEMKGGGEFRIRASPEKTSIENHREDSTIPLIRKYRRRRLRWGKTDGGAYICQECRNADNRG